MQQLSIQDASFIYLETPATPMHVGSLCIYDGSQSDPARLTQEAITRTVDERLHLNATTRRRLVKVPFEADFPYWIEDKDFDLEYHLRRVALPSPGDRDALQQLASRIFARPLDMTKPLWELTVIEGLNNIPGLPENSFAVLTKTHHAAVDGASGLHFLELLHDLSPAPTTIPPATEVWHPEPVPTDAELLFRSGVNNLSQPFRFAQTLGRQLSQPWRGFPGSHNTSQDTPLSGQPKPVPKTRFNGHVTPHRVLGSISVSLADIKEIRQVQPGATVNDVVLTVCGGALRSYLDAKNEVEMSSLIAMAPVNLRSSDERGKFAAGNRVSALFVSIGTDIEDPLARLQHIHAETSNSKIIHQAVGASDMTDYSKFVPAFTAALASRLMTETAANAPAPPFNVSITNVPGPQEPLYFCGAPMVTAIGLGPITQGMGLIFPVLSYCGRVTISFTSCREILPDPEFFEACLTQSFTTLLYSARLNSERTQFTEH
ncbi:MAG: wax ester/triacylglycerol synthase family O-acyltransferase [bacterium]